MAIQGSPSAAYPFPVTLCWLNATLRNNLDSFSAASNTVQCSHFRLWVTLSFCLMPSLPILESPVTIDLAHSDAVPELLMPSARSNLSLSLLGLLAPSFCLSNNWHCVSQASVSCRIYFSSSWDCKRLRESNYFRSMYLFITAYLWCVCVHAGTCIPPCTCEVKRQSSGVTCLLHFIKARVFLVSVPHLSIGAMGLQMSATASGFWVLFF